AEASGILLCPSNPVVSIAPILAVPGVRAAVEAAGCRGVAVPPIVGGAPVRGMADKLLPAWGAEVSARGVAGLYAGLADAFVLDAVDGGQAAEVAALGLEPVVVPTLMRTVEDAAALAKAALEALGGVRPEGSGEPRRGTPAGQEASRGRVPRGIGGPCGWCRWKGSPRCAPGTTWPGCCWRPSGGPGWSWPTAT